MRIIFLILSIQSFASHFESLKKEFEDAVARECPVKIKPTRGRTGNMIKWKTCTSDSINIGGCVLTCEDPSSKIGGQ